MGDKPKNCGPSRNRSWTLLPLQSQSCLNFVRQEAEVDTLCLSILPGLSPIVASEGSHNSEHHYRELSNATAQPKLFGHFSRLRDCGQRKLRLY